jgi:tetratricopeptide (TPR) repeat protein
LNPLFQKNKMSHFLITLLKIALVSLFPMMLTVLFHELGHAISIMLLTKKEVVVYIGSFGNKDKSLKIKFGLLTIFLNYNPFGWRGGLCVPSYKNIPLNSQIIYLLAGPLSSLLLASIAFFSLAVLELYLLGTVFFVLLSIIASIDFVWNIFPRSKQIRLHNNQITYNDGYKLKELFHFKQLPKEFEEAIYLYNDKQYDKSATLLQQLLSRNIADMYIYRLAINSYLQTKDYNKAKMLSDTFILTNKMNSDDLSNMALCYSQQGFREEALHLYDKSLLLNPNSKIALNNKGYTLNLMNRFEEAIPLLDKAIEMDNAFAYAYCNRGLSMIKSGRTAEGLQDLHKSLEISPENAYCYKHLGIYHFDKMEFNEALELFLKSKEIDETTSFIEELIANTQEHLSPSKTGQIVS